MRYPSASLALALGFSLLSLSCARPVAQAKTDAASGRKVQGEAQPWMATISMQQLEEVAMKGDAEAARVLANRYFFDERNGERGTYWRRRSAELGSPIGQFSHGGMLFSNARSDVEREEGLKFVRLSAAQGNLDAKEFLKFIESDLYKEYEKRKAEEGREDVRRGG